MTASEDLLLAMTHTVLSAAPYLAAASALTLGTWLLISLRRGRATREALRGRVRVEVVPSSTFDPSEAELRRWGHHLGRITYAAHTIPTQARAARLSYVADGGRMRCYLEGPGEGAAVVAMPGFAQVEVRPVDNSHSRIEPVRFPAHRLTGES